MANLPCVQGVAAPVTVTDESDIAQQVPLVESSGEAAQKRQFWQIEASLPGVSSAPSSSTARNCHSLVVWVYVVLCESLLIFSIRILLKTTSKTAHITKQVRRICHLTCGFVGSSDRIRTGDLRLESPPWSPSGLYYPHLLAHFKSDLPPNHAKSLFADSSRGSHSSRILRGCFPSMAHPCTKHSCHLLARLSTQNTTPNKWNTFPERPPSSCTLLDARNAAAARRRQR